MSTLYRMARPRCMEGCGCPIEYDPYGTGDHSYSLADCQNGDNCPHDPNAPCNREEEPESDDDEEESDDSPVLITSNTILSGGELMAKTFNQFNQIFGAKS